MMISSSVTLKFTRHCEKRSDEAISRINEIASLSLNAMDGMYAENAGALFCRNDG